MSQLPSNTYFIKKEVSKYLAIYKGLDISKLLITGKLVLLGLLVISCVQEGRQNKIERANLFMSGSLLCEEGKVKTKGEVESFFDNAEKMLNEHNNTFLFRWNVRENFKYTSKNPLIFDPNTLEGKIESLKKRAKNDFPAGVVGWLETGRGDFSFLSHSPSESKEYEKLLGDILKLAREKKRYEGVFCRRNTLRERSNHDVREFLEIKENGDAAKSGEVAFRLCSKLDDKTDCFWKWKMSKRNGREKDFVLRQVEKFKSTRYEALFSLNNFDQAVVCSKSEDKFIINLRLDISGLEDSKFYLIENSLEKVEEFWSRERVKLNIERGGDGVKVTFHDKSGINHFNHSKRLLSFSKDLSGTNFIKIFAHEVGHVLGFDDCYLEFINKGQYIYYELDHERNNLMCSLSHGHKVPASYFNEIKEKLCSPAKITD